MLLRAKKIAREAHAGQFYGEGADYVEAHVAKVAALVEQYGGSEEQIAAAWLHDVVEDSDVELDFIYAEFGWIVGGIVGAVTGVGRNREARNAVMYAKVAMRPEAALVKVADRIANVEASPYGSKHLVRYVNERDAFDAKVAALAPPEMRQRLNAAFNLKELA